MKYLFRLDQVTRLNFFHQSDHSGNQQPPRPGGEICFPTGKQGKRFFTILLRWEKLSYFWFRVSPFWMLNPEWIRAWNFRLKSVLRQVLAGSVNMGRWKERDGTDWSIRTCKRIGREKRENLKLVGTPTESKITRAFEKVHMCICVQGFRSVNTQNCNTKVKFSIASQRFSRQPWIIFMETKVLKL